MECLHKILISRTPPLEPVKVPCGQCIACRLNRASSWAVRIMHEKKTVGDACFVTLTYDQEHAPWVSDSQATLVKKDVQNFLKRLRKQLEPAKIRYYLCGEYGEHGHRPHYHIILFGLSKADAERIIPSVWTDGMFHIGDVTFDSAAYVARYCTKLLTGPKKIWYEERNIIPEFSLMSRKPGIGAEWLKKYGNEVKTHHNVVMKGRKMSPPRYYQDKVYDESDRRFVRSSIVNKIVAQIKQELKDYEVSPTLPEERVAARENTILAKLHLRKRQ